jgi:hypothetical protein
MKLKKPTKRKPTFTKVYKLKSGMWGFREESSTQRVQYHHGFKTKKLADTALKEKKDERN